MFRIIILHESASIRVCCVDKRQLCLPQDVDVEFCIHVAFAYTDGCGPSHIYPGPDMDLDGIFRSVKDRDHYSSTGKYCS